MSTSNLNKKRARPSDPLIITIGKQNHSYYYISDSLSGGGTKIKISMVDLSNTKEEKQISLKEHEEENDASLDILNLSHQILKDELPKIVNNIKANEAEKIYLPISSSWFNMDNIHEIEIKSIPEFFCGKYPSKTPQVYKNYRNFIINLYRENSTMYLSSNTCRKHLPGDACAIMRIHSLLEHWGLINFKLNQKFKPSFIPKAINFKSPVYIDSNLFMLDNYNNKDSNSNNCNNNIANYNNPESNIVLTNKRKKIATLYPINKISNKIFNNFIDNFQNLNKYIDENPTLDLKKIYKINFLLKNYRPKCDVCGNFCTMEWHISKDNLNNAKNNDDEKDDIESSNEMNVSISIDEKSVNREFFIVCEECYLNSDIPLPNNLKRENFELCSIINLFSKEKINNKIKNRINKENWTEEENKKLLEGLKNKQNWEEIVKSIGNNKTKNDCYLHLLQMPINDIDENIGISKDTDMEEDEEEFDQREIKSENIKEKSDEKLKNMNIENENEMGEGENRDGENSNTNKINMDELNEENNKKENFEINTNENKKMGKMIEIFIRLFRRYLNENENGNNNEGENGDISNKSFKEVIYKTFAKSINKCKELKNDEKNEMKNIVDILVYLEMKKIELKMNYFKHLERLLEFKKTQLKKIETDIIQERIKLITKKLLLQKKQQKANENK